MKPRYFIVALFPVIVNIAIAQNVKNHSLSIVASLPAQIIGNADDLKFKILIKNNSDNAIKVYKYLSEGYASDPNANLNLVVEQKGKSGYNSYSRGSLYQRIPEIEPVAEIEKVDLKAKDSIVNFFHLDDAYLFKPGSYRVKCIYKNNLKKGGKISSSWVYFRVTGTIPIKHYYNE